MDPDRRMRASSSLRSLAKHRSWKSACVRNRLQLHTRIGIKNQRCTESKDSAQSALPILSQSVFNTFTRANDLSLASTSVQGAISVLVRSTILQTARS